MLHVMVDANIIVSAVLFPHSVVAKVLKHILDHHTLQLSQYTINEMQSVFQRKFPDKIASLNQFLSDLKYELIDNNIDDFSPYPRNRDNDDIPVLAYSIEAESDLFITGDKDFDEIVILKPKILKPKDYQQKYM